MENGGLRNEITARAVALHSQLTTAAILWFALLLAIIYLAGTGQGSIVVWLLLGASPIFSALTFNSQSNQVTLETAAQYLAQTSSSEKGWEDYWANRKKTMRLLSVAKTAALLLPQLAILVWLTANTADLDQTQQLLLAFDWLMGLVVLINFRQTTALSA